MKLDQKQPIGFSQTDPMAELPSCSERLLCSRLPVGVMTVRKKIEQWVVLGGLAIFALWLFVILPLLYWLIPAFPN